MTDYSSTADILPIAGPATEEFTVWAPNLAHPDGLRTYVEFIDSWNRNNLSRHAGTVVVHAVVDPVHRERVVEYVTDNYVTDIVERNRLLGNLGLNQVTTKESIAS